MGKATPQAGPVRDSVIQRSPCCALRRGVLALTVPMFGQFVGRALGEDVPRA